MFAIFVINESYYNVMIVVLQFTEIKDKCLILISDSHGGLPVDASKDCLAMVQTESGVQYFMDSVIFNQMICCYSYPIKLHATLFDKCIVAYCLKCVKQ